ncbi:MAG: CYTH domain-containing protein [Clostridiales bacterium]|nr:CYTH domain-containing protein [Clostridiales bacterium]MCI7573768.1 CYTH domain-containing protein [Clostridiales bacterium]
MGRELELKFAASSETLDAMEEKYAPLTPITMHTRYFDTPHQAFRGRRWTLRLRLENGRPICTLKTRLSDGSRGEYETESGDIVSAIPALLEQGAPAELEELAREGLEEVCGARFTRLARIIDVPGGQVELALDRGEFTGGGRTLPFTEAEAELKAGPDEVLARFGRALAEEFSLREEPRSKIQRAMALAEK